MVTVPLTIVYNPPTMKDESKIVSMAVETSCRAGGLALAVGVRIVDQIAFDASQRHAVRLVSRLKELVERAGISPSEIDELYISAGPGSFTGLRVGITVARTMAQALPNLRCVVVPTVQAVATLATGLEWLHLAVVLDAGEGNVYGAVFIHEGGGIAQQGPSVLARPLEFLASVPRPALLIGEGLKYHGLAESGAGLLLQAGAGLSVYRVPHEEHFPTALGVWQVGWEMARGGLFTPTAHMVPIYSRLPAVLRTGQNQGSPGAKLQQE